MTIGKITAELGFPKIHGSGDFHIIQKLGRIALGCGHTDMIYANEASVDSRRQRERLPRETASKINR
jgi:hypothetical protein